MPNQVDISPAVVIQQWAVNQLLGADPDVLPLGLWPIYVATVPDGAGAPSNLVSIYDTGETPQGTRLRTGEQIVRFNYQFAVRTIRYPIGYVKARQFAKALEKVNRVPVVVNSQDESGQPTYGVYIFHSARRINLLSTGREPDQLARWLITSNGTASISKFS